MNGLTALTVSQVNFYIKSLFDADYRLSNICVSGEISNFVNHYKTGHFYFTLKDEKSAVKCVMFASNTKRIMFLPEDGMKVIVKGKISVFERDGIYQIYVDDIQPDGAGALAIAFEQMKNRLASEGLFDESRKKAIPRFPKKIGLITSDTGAAVKDVINVLSRRYPLAEVLLFPVAVQGNDCPFSNIRAFDYFNSNKNADVIIICRGGGSIEDLWGYNDERLVRKIAECEIPVISGVGHEIDFTLCDFVADLRAPTPSAAAELCVPDCNELINMINVLKNKVNNGIESVIDRYNGIINGYKLSILKYSPEITVKNTENLIEIQKQKLDSAIENYMKSASMKLDGIYDKLIVLNPVNLLKNGNLIAFKNEKKIKSVTELDKNDRFKIYFADGSADCTVNKVEYGEK